MLLTYSLVFQQNKDLPIISILVSIIHFEATCQYQVTGYGIPKDTKFSPVSQKINS